jgi:hypothetical protein
MPVPERRFSAYFQRLVHWWCRCLQAAFSIYQSRLAVPTSKTTYITGIAGKTNIAREAKAVIFLFCLAFRDCHGSVSWAHQTWAGASGEGLIIAYLYTIEENMDSAWNQQKTSRIFVPGPGSGHWQGAGTFVSSVIFCLSNLRITI